MELTRFLVNDKFRKSFYSIDFVQFKLLTATDSFLQLEYDFN